MVPRLSLALGPRVPGSAAQSEVMVFTRGRGLLLRGAVRGGEMGLGSVFALLAFCVPLTQILSLPCADGEDRVA